VGIPVFWVNGPEGSGFEGRAAGGGQVSEDLLIGSGPLEGVLAVLPPI
jgi:hypothetical protein